MAEKKTKSEETQDKAKEQAQEANVAAKPEQRGGRGGKGNRGGREGRGPRGRREKGADDKYDTNMINVRRVARQYHGGRRMRFSTFVVVGDREGSVGVGVGKAKDIPSAQRKAKDSAQKSMITVPLKGNTIPHAVEYKYKSSRVLLMPAAPGTGVVAGKTVKAVAELAGIKDLLTKVLGSTNPVNTAYATVEALKELREKRL